MGIEVSVPLRGNSIRLRRVHKTFPMPHKRKPQTN
jgi:hypothetical protein